MQNRLIRFSSGHFLLAILLVALKPCLAWQASIQSPGAIEQSTPGVVRSAGPSVVTIVLRDGIGRVLGTGSGFVIAADGRVLTNAHVVQMNGVAQAEAKFQDGSFYQVQGVIAIDSECDLALIKLKAVGRIFQTLRLGNSDNVEIGQKVIAIGSPMMGASDISTEETVSDGIVSGKRDWHNGKMQLLQITAPVSPGSSGGALLNVSGEVVGVTFAQLREGQNLNFTIPINYAGPLLAMDTPPRSLSEVGPNPSSTPLTPKATEPELTPEGSYTGVWQSSSFNVSGAATMTIRISGLQATANIFLTGGEVKSASLAGWAQKTGQNIWTVELVSKHPKLSVRGIFRNNSFVGDYTYTRFALLDRGHWILKKE